MKLYLKIKEYRQKKGLTQLELANFIGIDYQTISKYETGANTPSIERAVQIAIALDVSIDDLIDINKYMEDYHNEIYKIMEKKNE